ncbi:MAG: ABC transporter substrate-binding protein, partial [Chloroflexota bacterium]
MSACGGSSEAAPLAGSGSSIAAAQASGAPSTPEQLAAYQGSDRQQILEAGAKKEGTLTWNTS